MPPLGQCRFDFRLCSPQLAAVGFQSLRVASVVCSARSWASTQRRSSCRRTRARPIPRSLLHGRHRQHPLHHLHDFSLPVLMSRASTCKIPSASISIKPILHPLRLRLEFQRTGCCSSCRPLFPLALQHGSIRPIIRHGRERLAALHRDRRIARDDHIHQSAKRLDARCFNGVTSSSRSLKSPDKIPP